MALLKFCRKQGCKNLTDQGYCQEHQQESQAYDQYRESSSKRGYDSRWRKARKGWLEKHPLCVECEKEGVLKAATELDHIVPHRGDKRLFWDRDNWQGLCKSCHSRKTAKEDGGFGNGKSRSAKLLE